MSKVRSATTNDIAEIIVICQQNLAKNKDQSQLSKTGFLFGELTFDALEKEIKNPQDFIILVCVEDKKIIGYLTAQVITEVAKVAKVAKVEIDFYQKVKELLGEIPDKEILYYKQIAKKIGEKNVGSKLLTELCKTASEKGYSHLVCKIIHQPFFNQNSIDFHQKNGFQQIGLRKANGNLAGIYLKKLS